MYVLISEMTAMSWNHTASLIEQSWRTRVSGRAVGVRRHAKTNMSRANHLHQVVSVTNKANVCPKFVQKLAVSVKYRHRLNVHSHSMVVAGTKKPVNRTKKVRTVQVKLPILVVLLSDDLNHDFKFLIYFFLFFYSVACKDQYKYVCDTFDVDCGSYRSAGDFMRRYCPNTCNICSSKLFEIASKLHLWHRCLTVKERFLCCC